MFWIFWDAYCFAGFFTQILYILTPIAFVIQLTNNVLKEERVSIFGLLCMYSNAFVYFWTSFYKVEEGKDIDPLDFCNLAGFYVGFIYLAIYIYFIHFKNNKTRGIYIFAILIVVSVAVWLIILFTVKPGNVWDKIFNWLGVVFNVCEYFPLGFSILYLLRNRISEKYTLFGAFFGMLNTVTWEIWAIHAQMTGGDLIHSICANILGICLQITQFVLFFVFRKDDPEDNKSVGERPEDIDFEIEKQKQNEPEYMHEFI